ncbi:hypothetical protein Rhein_2746 [Rheinheimera sp. A13L]|nr:hypothetical protein Rhein_2746 [Rheinheimera sp. A13L]
MLQGSQSLAGALQLQLLRLKSPPYLALQRSGGDKPRPYNLLNLIRVIVGATFMVARSF